MAEAAIVRAVQRELDRLGAFHVKTTGVSVVGVPDILGTLRGRGLALEVKQPRRYPTAKQRWMLDRAAAAGAIAGVVRSTTDLHALLRAHNIDPEER